MKKLINILSVLALACMSTSCLKSNLEVLPNAKDAYIQSVNSVVYRWVSEDKEPSSGEPKVKQAPLTQKSTIDKEAGTVAVEVKIPDGFPEKERSRVNASNLVVSLVLSSASRIAPLDGSAILGVPADWSKPNKYRVTAANGTIKDWTITLTLVP